MIEKAYVNSILSAAAYADWSDSTAEVRRSLIAHSGLTEAQADEIFFDSNSRFTLYHYTELPNGFSATIFRERSTGDLTVAFRGTEPVFPYVDALTDLSALLGNTRTTLEPFFNQSNSIGDFLKDAGLDVDGALTQTVNFTGHSLGGYLALMAGYQYSADFGEIYTYNGLGLNPIESAWESVANLFEGIPIDQSRVHNVFADKGWEAAASPLLSRPGERLPVFIEEGATPLHNHEIARLVQSLSAYHLLGLLSPGLDSPQGMAEIYATLDAASNMPGQSIEVLLDQLGTLLGGDFAQAQVKADIGLFAQQVVDAGVGHDIVSLAPEVLDAGTLAALAREDTEAGRGYRYALLNLMPLALTSGVPGTAAAQPAYGADRFSGEFMVSRSAFLGLLQQRNTRDLASVPAVLESTAFPLSVFADFDTGLELQTFAAAADPRRHLFGMEGDDPSGLDGGDSGDYLFGRAGSDVLMGMGGSDVLDGGAGDDHIEGGPGSDFIIGGAGADRIHWRPGDGDDVIGDYDDGGDRLIVDGVDLASLNFQATAAGSPFYSDSAHPGITLHYAGGFLEVAINDGAGRGTMLARNFSPVTGRDYGIALQQYLPQPPVTDITVATLGWDAGEVGPLAYERQWPTAQGGLDWAGVAIRFNAADVVNYRGGSLHGTVGGAFEGGPMDDDLSGDATANALHGLGGADHLQGGEGDDFLEGWAGADTLSGGAGADLLFGDTRVGLAGLLDPASARGQFYLAQLAVEPTDQNVLAGGAGDDKASGGRYSDYIQGDAGSDYLLGGGGSDYLDGGAGRDIIYGDSALAYRVEESGTDGALAEVLEIAFAGASGTVGQHDDVIHGGADDDTLWGELGDDIIHGGEGSDNLVGDRYDDPAYFGAELHAYGVTAAELDASLHGDDRLYGGAGSDLLLGLGGDDLLAGGPDSDSLLGGAGNDSYYFEAGDGLDYIDDSQGIHTLVFSGVDPADLQVIFRGDKVRIGTGLGAEGFYLSRDQWPAVRISLDTPDAPIERSRLDTVYQDAQGNTLLTLAGTSAMSEAERAAVVTVDDSDADQPRIAVGAGVESVEIEALSTAEGGAVVRLGAGIGLLLSRLLADRLVNGVDALFLLDGAVVSLAGFAGDLLGSQGSDRITGTGLADTIRGGSGDDALYGRDGGDRLYGDAGRDVLAGEAGNDRLEGGSGDDTLLGGAGDDYLLGGLATERDRLQGGRGDDTLQGGPGPDHYLFDSGDGHDLISDPDGYHYLEFSARVDPTRVAMYMTAADDSHFRVEYGQDSELVSRGGASAHWIDGVTVGGAPIPLVHRSDVSDGFFHDTRWDDVFETGAGSDTIYIRGWGDDVLRLQPGDGPDTVQVTEGYYPETRGEIRFGAGVDLANLTFSFLNGITTINYGSADAVTLETDTVFTFRDNVLNRFTLGSEADPDWQPLIRAQGSVGNLYGSFGADHIVGNANIETILPGYGDDFIEAGDGPDTILLNELYMAQGRNGIGHKTIVAGGDNDAVYTPLFQGLSFHYSRGDGEDIIYYDWSWSAAHPYRFTLDRETATAALQPYGQDTLVFGENIALGDLRFTRSEDELSIALADSTGGIRLPGFFHTWDEQTTGDDGQLYQLLSSEGAAPDSLLDPVIRAVLPRVPLARMGFADGSIYDMTEVLESFLVQSQVNLVATDGDDYLLGTDGDDILVGGLGDDTMDGAGGNDVFVIEGHDQGKDRIIGGPGLDLIVGGAGDDSITLTELTPADGVEFIHGGEGRNFLTGTGIGNTLDFSATQLVNINRISGRGGRDEITGSAGDDLLAGGRGNDILSGGAGSDTYLFAAGHGRDRVDNADADPASVDVLRLRRVEYDQVWLSRLRDHLAVNIAGTDDRVLIRGWYADQESQLDAIHAGDRVLLREQVDRLVNAMAGFDVPEGVDSVISGEAQAQLQPLLAEVWQATEQAA